MLQTFTLILVGRRFKDSVFCRGATYFRIVHMDHIAPATSDVKVELLIVVLELQQYSSNRALIQELHVRF
jgi:hypothetical protein